MKKRVLTFFIALFLVLSLLPSVGLLAFGPSGAFANQILAFKPELIKTGRFNKEVLNDVSAYFEDRTALRKEFVTAWAKLNSALFGTSVQDQVILGKGGTLYYASTLDDYMGRSLSDEELYYAAHTLALMQEYVQGEGGTFVFTIAPNKNSILPENMPSRFSNAHEQANLVKLPALLEDEDVRYADLYSKLEGRGDLYYKTDSHWNDQGAAVGADVILEAMGQGSPYAEAQFSMGGSHFGDLYEMLYPAAHEREVCPSYLGVFHFSGAVSDAMKQRIETTNSDKTSSLLCFRDSFGSALYPYLAEQFGSAVFKREARPDLTVLKDEPADVMLYELVERNISWLNDMGAIYPAPQREAVPFVALDESISYQTPGTKAADRSLSCVSGQLNVACDVRSAVYIVTDDGRFYEATVSVVGAEKAFTAWLQSDVSIKKILVVQNGQWVAYQASIER